MKRTFKENEECYCLYVNVTTNYISFKIEVGKFLGSMQQLDEDYFAVEHKDDEVNYLRMVDIYRTEEAAMSALSKMLKKKVTKGKK